MIALVETPGEINMAALGRRLRKFREERGMAATRLDELAGVGRGSVSRIEHADRPELSVLVLAKIAYFLNVQLDWLVWGDRGKTSAPPDECFMPGLGFLNLVQRLPDLAPFLATSAGVRIPPHALARGVKAYYEKPGPALDPDGIPVGGWAAFLGEKPRRSSGKATASMAARQARRKKNGSSPKSKSKSKSNSAAEDDT